MKFHIPFTIANLQKLKKKSKFLTARIKLKPNSVMAENLKNSSVDISREEYLGIVRRSFIWIFIVLFAISTTVLALLRIEFFYLYGFGIAMLSSLFVFFSQMVYPGIYVSRRQRGIEKNLISALQDVLVQLTSGIPLFSVLVNISDADYGELSEEFKKAVKRINAGEPETEVLDDLAKRNPSIFFRRALWQISNGMKAGSDLALVIRDSIKALNEEQLIQIQNYGNKMNPLIMFYMLASVIIPALSITFLTILSSMINLNANVTMMLYISLFVFVLILQVIFLGLIKSRRPSLL